MSEKITSIRIRQSTKDKLASVGNTGESFEDVIKMLLHNYDESITFD